MLYNRVPQGRKKKDGPPEQMPPVTRQQQQQQDLHEIAAACSGVERELLHSVRMITTWTHLVHERHEQDLRHFADHIHALTRRNGELARMIVHRDDVAAQLFQRIENLEGMLERAAARPAVAHPATATSLSSSVAPPLLHECACCFDQTARGVACSAADHGHIFCLRCVDAACEQLVAHAVAAPTAARVPCFSYGGTCSGTIPFHECMRVPHGRRVVREAHLDEARDHVLHAARDADARTLQRLALLRADGAYAAVQCAACGYGPMLHAHCADLDEHHGQVASTRESGGHVRYSNACPRCGARAASVTDLPPWDGE